MANKTTTRPLSFWAKNDLIQFPQLFNDYWPKMKVRAEASANGYQRTCSDPSCNGAACRGANCSCICHYALPGPQLPDTENLPLFMSGIQRSKTEPNLATHPAVTVRKYILGNETGEGQTPFNQWCVPASGGTQMLPWIHDPVFNQCCPGPQQPLWFARRPPASVDSKEKLRNPYNERARSGFKYWYMERPKPTQFGRYSVGSKHTQMGLGFAPRS